MAGRRCRAAAPARGGDAAARHPANLPIERERSSVRTSARPMSPVCPVIATVSRSAAVLIGALAAWRHAGRAASSASSCDSGRARRSAASPSPRRAGGGPRPSRHRPRRGRCGPGSWGSTWPQEPGRSRVTLALRTTSRRLARPPARSCSAWRCKRLQGAERRARCSSVASISRGPAGARLPPQTTGRRRA